MDAAADVWGWDVIQVAGAYSDINTEIQRRFLELPAPYVPDGLDEVALETMLVGLGRTDVATKGLGLLAPYTQKPNKVKRAKESVTKLISRVGPSQARKLIQDMMLPRKAGVGMQMAGLRLIVELDI